MPSESITLKFRERGRIVWNREVVYQDFVNAESKAYILAGNENGWLSYANPKKDFTPDFTITLIEFALTYVRLYIRYGTDVQERWSCSGAPNYICYQTIGGKYATQAECKAACKGAPCTPVWKCEEPRNGYDNDGCGTRRRNAVCDPIVSVPLSLSASPTTIKVGELITVSGKYKSGARVIIYEDVLLGKTFAETTCNSAGAYRVMIYLNKPIGTYRIRARSDVIIFPDLSKIVTITIIAADTPCTPVWRCKEPTDGYETDGCGRTAYNSLCLPEDPKLPCADGNTRIVQCPDNPSKTYTEKCTSGKWIVDKDMCKPEDKDKAKMLYYILLAVVVIMVIMIIIKKRGK